MNINRTEINSDGNLIFYFNDDTFHNVGKVTGNDGSDGQIGIPGPRGFQGSRGEKGSKGEAGNNGVNGGDSGLTTFKEMIDTPSLYSLGKLLIVNSSSDGITYNGIVVGGGNNNVISNTTIIGDNAGNEIFNLNKGRNNTLYGYKAGAKLSGENNTFIGSSAGFSATAFGDNICIGNNSCNEALNGNHSIILGSDTNLGKKSVSNYSIIIGNKSTICDTYQCSNTGKSLIVGYNSAINSSNSIIIGDNSKTEGHLSTDRNHILVGFNNEIISTEENTDSNENSTENCITIGSCSKILADNKSTNNSIAIGYKSYVNDSENGIAIVLNTYDDSLGEREPGVFSDNGIAIGKSARSAGRSSISMGSFSVSEGEYSIAIGNSMNDTIGAEATGKHSISIGTNSRSNYENSVSLGINSETDRDNQFALAENIKYMKLCGINYKWPSINSIIENNSVLTIDDDKNLIWKSLDDNSSLMKLLSNSYEHYNYIFSESVEFESNKIYFNKFFISSSSRFNKVELLIDNNNEKLFNIKVGIYDIDNNNLPNTLLSFGEKSIERNVNKFLEIDLDSLVKLNTNKEYYLGLLYNSQYSTDKLGIYSYKSRNDIKNIFKNKDINGFQSLPNPYQNELEKGDDTYWFRLKI